jgi:dTDP-4-amino-4,6-dideoxygalactose transaminase
VINLFQPSVGREELSAVEEVFASSWLGAGERVAQFERAFAAYVGSDASSFQAIASCTEGLFQAVAALGLGPGDEVIIPSISFIGAAHAVRANGAHVALCDVNPFTLNPDIEDIERAVTPRARAVMILHYGGASGPVAEIAALAASRSLALIEDAACALGTFVDGRACGTFGDVGVWSFDAMKVLTTADGGMVWCKDPAVAARIHSAIRLGVNSSGFSRRSSSNGWWEIDPPTMGRRATMNDVAGAIGLVQLERLADFLRRRREIATAYDAAFRDVAWLTCPEPRSPTSAHTFYWLQTSPEVRNRLATYLLDREIYTNFRYWPLHMTAMYGSPESFPGADRAAESTLLLPQHQSLSDIDVAHVIDSVRAFRP